MTRTGIILVGAGILLTAVCDSGCAAKHHGYAQASTYYRSMMSTALSDPSWYASYYNETDPIKRKAFRDRLIGYCVWLADDDFNIYVAKFSKNQTRTAVAFDLAGLGVSSASAVANPAQLLGAVATGIQGAHATYDRDALDQQTRSAILLKMDALREERLASIYRSEQLPDDQYSLIQGLIDVQLYVNAGSVHAALASISQDAAIQHQSSATALKAVRDLK